MCVVGHGAVSGGNGYRDRTRGRGEKGWGHGDGWTTCVCVCMRGVCRWGGRYGRVDILGIVRYSMSGHGSWESEIVHPETKLICVKVSRFICTRISLTTDAERNIAHLIKYSGGGDTRLELDTHLQPFPEPI